MDKELLSRRTSQLWQEPQYCRSESPPAGAAMEKVTSVRNLELKRSEKMKLPHEVLIKPLGSRHIKDKLFQLFQTADSMNFVDDYSILVVA